MGLRFSHADAYFSFTTFHEFRRRLAQLAGINLEEMQGYTDPPEAGKPWSEVDDPIVYLLDHSDCDGEISPEECEELAPRLRELLDKWSDESDDGYAYFQVNGRQLADGLAICPAMNHSLQFYG